jgi:hypothetical protein
MCIGVMEPGKPGWAVGAGRKAVFCGRKTVAGIVDLEVEVVTGKNGLARFRELGWYVAFEAPDVAPDAASSPFIT